MEPSDSISQSAAAWPPDDMQILFAMRAAQMAGTFSQKDADQMDEGPKETWPPDLWEKLGFSPPPGPSPLPPANTPPADSVETAWAALKAEGYPKQDQDPATGETFQTYPEEVIYNPEHPLYHSLPDNARPETWRELDSANFNPSKARSIYTSPNPARDLSPSNERIDAAVVAAICSRTIGEKEMSIIRQTPQSQWPESLWADLDLPTPEEAPARVRVEISVRGTFHHITQSHDQHPFEGDEHVQFSRIQVNIYDTRLTGEDACEPMQSVIFSEDDESLGVHSDPPEPPWRGVVDEVGCSSKMEREIEIAVNQEIPVELGTLGISIGTHTIEWSEVTENGGLDCYYDLTAYWNGEPMGEALTSKLYVGDRKNSTSDRANLLAILEEIDYIAAYSTGRCAGLSPSQILDAAGKDRSFLQMCVLSMSWERARHISGPYELTKWIAEHHPESPECKTAPRKTETEANTDSKPEANENGDKDEDEDEEWPPSRFRILCAMRARRMAGTMTSQDVERMDEGPPETWPLDLWELLGFCPPGEPTESSESSTRLYPQRTDAQSAQPEAPARQQLLVDAFEQEADRLKQEANGLKQELAAAEQRAELAASTAQKATAQAAAERARANAAEADKAATEAAALDPAKVVVLELRKLNIAHRAVVETILNGGTIDQAVANSGFPTEEAVAIYRKFYNSIIEAASRAAKLAHDMMLGINTSLASPPIVNSAPQGSNFDAITKAALEAMGPPDPESLMHPPSTPAPTPCPPQHR